MRKHVIYYTQLFSLCAIFLTHCSVANNVSLTPEPTRKVVVPMSTPRIIIPMRADEKAVEIKKTEEIVIENSLFRRVRTKFVFTNPNARVMSGEFEFPIPNDAFVCGYSLDVNGVMVPGVVCSKEKARVTFENETRKGVDPGIVEQVKGNIWRTRIFPLNPKTPRRAEVDYIVPIADAKADCVVCERDGGKIFTGRVRKDGEKSASVCERIHAFACGAIVWDASLSAEAHSKAWIEKLRELPAKGEWQLFVFRNKREAAKQFTVRDELVNEVESLVYDGGTSMQSALKDLAGDIIFFSDEIGTLDECKDYETRKNIIVAGRADVPTRKILVEEVAEAPKDVEVKDGRLLATVWASERMKDLSAQASARSDEFLKLGREYGVAGEGLSLIVLETLQQYVDNKIEPPKEMTFHAEWMKRMAAKDDAIEQKKSKAEFEARLLTYWEERITWWKNPKPPKQTPKSGLFDGVRRVFSRNETAGPVDGVRAPMPEPDAGMVLMESAPLMEAPPRSARVLAKSAGVPPTAANKQGPTASVRLVAWNPDVPYLKSLDKVGAKGAYAAYLKERKEYRNSPAFYVDCAGWFFKNGEMAIAERVLTNLAEFKLEDAALWRTMGWRAREAGCYELACKAFAKAMELRGEEGQAYRDLALVKMEWGKWLYKNDKAGLAKDKLEEAMKFFAKAAFMDFSRRSTRRSNDFQVAIIALEELNGLISWCEVQKWSGTAKPCVPEFDKAYRRDLPVDVRIVLSWDADQTDIDLHVLEPNGEEAFYGHRRTAEGGFVSEDVTTGYGPEEYMVKEAQEGAYKVLSNYFASHQTALTGATTVSATVYTNWGRANEKMQVLTLRLDKPKDKHMIGEVKFGDGE